MNFSGNFTKVDIAWHNSTFIFYLMIIFVCYALTATGKYRVSLTRTSSTKSFQLWSVLVGAVLIFVKGFGTTGRDLREGYYLNFLSAKSLDMYRDDSVEIGYRILNVLIRRITDKYWVFILVVSILTICPVIYIIKKYSDKIDVPVAVLFYVSCFFFSGFSILRLALAASISLFAFDAIVEKKFVKALLWIFVAAMFHTAALLMFLPLFLCVIKRVNKFEIAIFLLIMILSIYYSRNNLTALLSESARYNIYRSFDTVKIGLKQFVYYIPMFIIYYFGRKADTNKHFSRMSFIYLSVGLFAGLLGYIVSIFGRMEMLFLPLIIIVPYYYKLCGKRLANMKLIINVLWIFYCIARFVIYIAEYYNMDDIMPYTNIFGWIV